ncbi:MAG: hypothetical protein JWR32_2764 [Mycobacterium sp.]|jgi:hypothetical protein|nr:hypothetical protein [Mycobacterium sp.]
MTLSRRLRLGLLAVMVTTTAVAAFFGLPAPKAQAFDSQYHERILRDALPPDGVDNIAMIQILNGPLPGAGAVGSDLFQNDEFRHFDNAKNPADVCVRARDAWNTFIPIVLSGARPAGPGSTVLANGLGARSAFGGLAHALADFYAHSNWVELNSAAGQPEQPGPPLFPTCNPAALPGGLHTGFFKLIYGLTGCPPGGPPPGFEECHLALNKDGPSTSRGGVPVPGTNMNHFDLAMLLATRATTELYGQVRSLVASTVNAHNPGVDGECVAKKLFQPGFEPCAGLTTNPLSQLGPRGGAPPG